MAAWGNETETAAVEAAAGSGASDRRRWSWTLVGVGCAVVFAVAVTVAWIAAGAAPRTVEPSFDQVGSANWCDRSNPAFVDQDPAMDPFGAAAQALRDTGYLVISDQGDGSCVFEDRPLGGG